MAEDGVIPEKYPLVSLPKGGYRQRARQNVVDSDGTAILHYKTLKGGTRLTRNLCALLKRPYILIDARQVSVEEAAEAVVKFAEENGVQTLNVARPRAWVGGGIWVRGRDRWSDRDGTQGGLDPMDHLLGGRFAGLVPRRHQ
jgi:hypothetical protein